MSDLSWGKWGTWEETESFLGKVLSVTEGVDAVELGSIRRWMESKEFACPLHTSKAVAQEHNYKEVIAPASMVFTYGLDAHWQDGDPPHQLDDEPKQISIPVIFTVPAPCKLSFATSVEVEFFEPMYVGDKITKASKLVDIQHKELSVGKGAFLRQEDTYTKQSGAVVAVSYLDIFRFSPPEDEQKKGKQDA